MQSHISSGRIAAGSHADDIYDARFEPVDTYEYFEESGHKRPYTASDYDMLVTSSTMRPVRSRPMLETSVYPRTRDSVYDEYSRNGVVEQPHLIHVHHLHRSGVHLRGNHFDEVTSETYNYMDALNTLDSETETYSECQTKREVTLPNFVSQTISPSTDSKIPDLQTAFVDENTGRGSESVDSPLDTSSAHVTKLWTNDDILGLEPSKPPDLSALNRSCESLLSGSKDTVCNSSSHATTTKLYISESSGKSEVEVARNKNMSEKTGYLKNVDGSPNTLSTVDRSSLSSEQLCGIIYNAVEANSSFKYSPSRHQQDDKSANQSSRKYVEASSFGHFEKTRDAYSDVVHDRKMPNNVPGPRLADTHNIEPQPNESDRNTNGFSSSFSELAQRFLANSLQRRVSHTSVDISVPYAVSTDVRSQETSVQNQPRDGPAEFISHISNIHGSFKKYVSSGLCYSENSSPPLEHMKISFHLTNGLETSKLRLDFPNVSLHKSMEDLTFPTFQLIPGPSLPVPDTGSEYDDDTFCRSSAYSSEDIHSPRSYLKSELWEHDERDGSKDNEMYDDLRRVSSSTAYSSSFMEFEQINQCGIDSADGSKNIEILIDHLSPHSRPITDLPDIDSRPITTFF